MSNQAYDQNLAFDTEMTATLNGTTQLLGVLANEPVVMLFKNQSTSSAFVADNSGNTKGTTMVAGETFVLDCRANKGNAINMGFPIGTSFFVTGTNGAGVFKISIIYAK